MRSRPGLASGLVLLGLVTASSGLLLGLHLVDPPEPATLEQGRASATSPVTSREFDDARQVALKIDPGVSRAVVLPSAGRVTASSCVSGEVLRSGESVVSVDGRAVLSLALEVPPWRDLRRDDQGEDVRALHAELGRLGHPAPDGDRVVDATLTAAAAVFASSGIEIRGEIPLTQVLWLPEAETRPSSCALLVGDHADVGDTVLSTRGPARVSIVQLPDGAAPGDREVRIGPARIRVDPDGRVLDDDVSAVLATDEFAGASIDESGARVVSGTWILRAPVDALVVPPGAIIFDASGASCVVDGTGTAVRVEVVGSELGQAFLRVEGEPVPSVVQVQPSGAATCG